jgi:SAM-dependent methyltransferase
MVRNTEDFLVKFENRPFSSNETFTSAALSAGLSCATAESGTMVDVGCADGLLLSHFARQRPGWRCIGTDVSAPNVETTSAVVSNLENASALLLDIMVDLLPESDVIIANSVFHLVPSPEEALAVVGRALRAGGSAVISVPDGRRINRWLISSRKLLLSLGFGRFLEHPRARHSSRVDRLAYLTVIPSIDDAGVIRALSSFGCTPVLVLAMERTHPLQPGHTLVVLRKAG